MGLFIFLAFGAGAFFGMVFVSVLSANTREEERNEAYRMGFKDCMHGRAPRVDIRR